MEQSLVLENPFSGHCIDEAASWRSGVASLVQELGIPRVERA
jgi:hypothetical protein